MAQLLEVKPTQVRNMNNASLRWAGLVIAFVLNTFVARAVNPVLITNVMPNNGFGSLVISGKFLYSVGDAFRIFDISNPANPVQVGAANIGGLGGSGAALSGNHAFILSGSLQNYYGADLLIFDISNPSNPVGVGQIDGGGGWFGVGASGNYLYLGGGSGPTGYFVQVYDVSDPANPVSVGQIKTSVIDAVDSIVVRDQLAYTVGSGTGLLVTDVTDPHKPNTPPQNQDAGGFDLALSGQFAFLAGGDTNYMSIWDISNPTNKLLVPNQANATGSSVVIWGNYAFTCGSMGLRITDISDPANAKLVFNSNSGFNAYTPSYEQSHMVAISGDYAYQGTAQGLLVYQLNIAAPSLGISTTATDVSLSWPTPTGAFVVQENPDLAPSHWITLTNAPLVVGAQNQVNILKTQSRMFYRLISQ